MSAQCPACEQNGALRVARQGMSGYLLSLFYIYPYRCKACWRSFRAIRWGTRYVLRQTNRRQYRRFETNLPVFLSWQDTPGEGIVTNLALGGCRLKSNLELTEKSSLKLNLQLPGADPVIRVDAAVVRAAQALSASLSFARVAADERRRLREFLIKLSAAKASPC